MRRMADTSDLGSADRRANWVALRTLRQRPAVVGRTEQGDTVYEVRSVRLLLVGGVNHFSQLVHCSKCGRAVPGAPVLAPADLERAPNPMFCARCSASTAPSPPPMRQPVAEPAPAPAPEIVELIPAEAPEDGRLAVVEAQLAVALAQLGAMAAAQAETNRQVLELAERVERLATDEAPLGEDLALLRAEVEAQDKRSAESAAQLAALEERLAAVVRETSAQLEAHRREAANELQEVAQDTMGALAEPLRALAGAHEDTDKRLASLAAWAGAAAARQDAVEQKVDDAVAELRGLVEAQQAKPVALRKRPGDQGGLLDALEQQLQAAAERLAEH